MSCFPLSHYMINRGFLEGDNYILDNAHKIKDIPCSIVQGRYDVICPPVTAWELHKVRFVLILGRDIFLGMANFHEAVIKDTGHLW